MLRGLNGLPSLLRGTTDCCYERGGPDCGKDCGGTKGGQGGKGGKARKGGKVLTLKNMNQDIVKMEYAVKGPVPYRAIEIAKEMDKGHKKSFKTMVIANLGDPQGMRQIPIQFIRQTMACCAYPALLQDETIPEDVKERSLFLLKNCGGNSVGSYTQSPGIEVIRENVAKYITARDGHPARAQDVVLQSGASTAIKTIIALFERDGGKPCGVLIPIPQFPMFSATIVEHGMIVVPYYLDEEKNWGLSMDELKRALEEGKKTSDVQVIVVINPGNPTSQVLPKSNIETVIKFAHENRLVILADEVHQQNVFGNHKFLSFKKVLRDMGEPYTSTQELASFMSLSKGFAGECGLRGGWAELVNMDEEVLGHYHKALSAMLCSSALGQIAIDCMVNPPKKGEPSFERWTCEVDHIKKSLAERALMVTEAFKKIEGIKCNEVQGSLYAFPNIKLSQKAIEAAKKDNKPPDKFYTRRLLEETGICVVAGSGFGQKPGSWHFRTTILPQPERLKAMLEVLQQFHAKFTKEFS